MENTDNQVLKTVAIIGRPNVGKSTLFNRLVGRRVAIETPVPGTTRDRLHAEVEWRGETLELIDVAGIETGSKKEIDASIQAGVELAIEAADLVLFVVDWNEKNNESDKRIARRLLPIKDKVLLVVNKADNIDRLKDIDEFQRIGPFPLIPVSAISGKSSGDLLDEVVNKLMGTKAERPARPHYDLKLSIIGRPNVGKSTLLNAVIGAKRAVVSEEPGTTRDIVDVQFSHKGKSILIADTAGIRRPGKILKDTIESFSVIRSYRALKNSDVAILVIDALEELTALDTNILGKAKEWGKGIVLAVNKIDLIEDQDHFMARELRRLQFQLNFAPWLPVVFISAADKTNINFLLNQVLAADENRRMVIPPEKLAEILADAKNANPQLIALTSLEQIKSAPPIFVARYKGREKPHYTQIRYLENRLRDDVPLNGTPLFIDLKK